MHSCRRCDGHSMYGTDDIREMRQSCSSNLVESKRVFISRGRPSSDIPLRSDAQRTGAHGNTRYPGDVGGRQASSPRCISRHWHWAPYSMQQQQRRYGGGWTAMAGDRRRGQCDCFIWLRMIRDLLQEVDYCSSGSETPAGQITPAPIVLPVMTDSVRRWFSTGEVRHVMQLVHLHLFPASSWIPQLKPATAAAAMYTDVVWCVCVTCVIQATVAPHRLAANMLFIYRRPWFIRESSVDLLCHRMWLSWWWTGDTTHDTVQLRVHGANINDMGVRWWRIAWHKLRRSYNAGCFYGNKIIHFHAFTTWQRCQTVDSCQRRFIAIFWINRL